MHGESEGPGGLGGLQGPGTAALGQLVCQLGGGQFMVRCVSCVLCAVCLVCCVCSVCSVCSVYCAVYSVCIVCSG